MTHLRANYTRGTHRTVDPRETLARIAPVLPKCGITRLADVTYLDNLGVPVYCALRPEAISLQVSNGKGLTPDAAKASALMEGIEFHHWERPLPERLTRTTLRALREGGHDLLSPEDLDGFKADRYFSEDLQLDWVEGLDLASGQPCWAPASAVYFRSSPSLFGSSTNGLASGNHLVEATLHALYELIERDAGSQLDVDNKLLVGELCRALDLETIPDPDLRTLIDQVQDSGTKVVLLWLESCVPVHTFWVLFLNQGAFASPSTFNVGWGTHSNPAVAACRAITEAAQARATFIHGAREDLLEKAVYAAEDVEGSQGYRFFDRLERDQDWSSLGDSKLDTLDLTSCYEELVAALTKQGHRLVRFDLTRPGLEVPVVKVLAPTLAFKRHLF